jgi:hypothetical protein
LQLHSRDHRPATARGCPHFLPCPRRRAWLRTVRRYRRRSQGSPSESASVWHRSPAPIHMSHPNRGGRPTYQLWKWLPDRPRPGRRGWGRGAKAGSWRLLYPQLSEQRTNPATQGQALRSCALALRVAGAFTECVF